jgi:hypothetical protein
VEVAEERSLYNIPCPEKLLYSVYKLFGHKKHIDRLSDSKALFAHKHYRKCNLHEEYPRTVHLWTTTNSLNS